MRLRLAKVDEFQFLTCLQHGLWGSRTARFKDWKAGDNFALLVNKKLAALSTIVGEQFSSKEKVWDNGTFPYRIRLQFTHVAEPEMRPAILGPIRDTLTKIWGTTYGWGILNQQAIESPHAEVIINAICKTPNMLQEFKANIDSRLEQARIDRISASLSSVKHKRGRKPVSPPPDSPPDEGSPISKRDESEHTRLQSELVDLGRITGCSVWLASNDQARKYQGKPIAAECLKKLPNLGLSDEATKRISLIDVIWVKQNAPVCAFEVETSTSIYSGLLRMSDLISVIPALNIRLYIVAQRERQDKVLRELARPTFRKIGLSEYCRYVAAEDLHELLLKVKDLSGSVQSNIVERISVELDETENSND